MEDEQEYEMVLICESVIVDEGYRYCGKKARWIAEWSDRQMIVCDEHRDNVRDAYKNDHKYDQDGLVWTRIVYHDDEE